MKKIKIYQLPSEHKAKFMDLDFVTDHSIMPKLEDYNLVWEGRIAKDADLEDLYITFQGKKPEGYTGHSLSTSDVVEFEGKHYYCDSFGWKEVFIKKYIVKAYGSSTYKSIYDTREEALAEANKLNDDYYEHKIWNVEEVICDNAETGSCTPQHLEELRNKATPKT